MDEPSMHLRSLLADRYLVEREIGRGGMATVYLAQDRKHDRPVALKVMQPEIAAAVGKERFLREIAIAARLQHPHILMLIDSGEASGSLFYVMPYIEGESLAERLARRGPLPIDQALEITREVASALGYAHARGVIHRDIKPDNIMLSDGHAMVMDFGVGLAVSAADFQRLTRTGIAIGTPEYMSPEQASGEATVDHRADVYSVGCVLYEMLAGTPPFTGGSARAVMARHAIDPVPSIRTVRSTVSPVIERVVNKALAKEPTDRFNDMSSLLQDLKQAAVTDPGSPISAQSGAADLRGRGSAHDSVPSIAVLPFVNMSTDADQEYFCDGMAEELINALVKIGGLRVASRTSAFSYKDTQKDVREIGDELDVGMVLEGSVRKVGRRLRITAQLINVPEGFHVWSERYDREMKDVFAIQDDISDAIIAALKVQFGMDAQARRAARPTTSLEAYDAYLRGIHAFNKRSRAENDRAIDLFERATNLDPSFALAFAALAGAYIEKLFTYEPDDAWEEKAFVALEKARRLDANLAEIYVAKGNLLWTRRNHFPHVEAIGEYRRAIELDPNLPDAYAELARVYWHIGLLDEAFEALTTAMEINAGFIDGLFRLAWLEMHRGNYERSLALFRRMPAGSLSPSTESLTARVLLCMDREREGRSVLDSIDSRHADDPDLASIQAIFHAVNGDTAGADGKIESAVATGRGLGHFHHVTYNVAVASALMKDNDRAMEWLEYTAKDGFPCHPWFERDPCLRPLRSDPRFDALLTRLKAEWRASALGL